MAGGGIPAGRLNIELVAELARLQSDLDRAKAAVRGATGDIARSAKAANDNLASMGTAAQQSAAVMIAAQDKLRAKYNESFAVISRYKAAQAEIREAHRIGALSADEMAAALSRQRQAALASLAGLKSQADAQRGVAGASGQARAGMQQLGFQLGDFSTQVSSGTSVTQAFAQQIGQTFQAIQLMSGGTSKFATFMGGPWGIALGVALPALAGLVGWMLKSDDAAKNSEKSHRDFAEVLRDNKAAWNEVAEAAAAYTKQQQRAREVTIQSAIETARNTSIKLKDAIATRMQLDAELQRRQKQFEEFSGMPGAEGATIIAMGERDKVRAELAENLKSVQALTGAANEAQVNIATLVAEMNADPAKRMAAGFDILRDQAKSAGLSVGELTKRLTELNRQQKAVEDQAKASGRKSDASLPNVTMNEVARLLGTSINPGGGLRTPAQNRAAGGAANSYHLQGLAIDIPLTINGRPLDKAGIRAELEKAGVIIKELLGPGDKGHGDHFHIAFARNRAGPDEIARKQEQTAARLQRDLAAIQREAEETAAGLLRLDTDLIESVSETRSKIIAGLDADLAASWDRIVAQGQAAAQNRVDQFDVLADAMGRLKDIGQFDLGDMFGKAGSAIDGMVDAMDRLTAATDAYNEARLNAGGDAVKLAEADKAFGDAKLATTVQMLGATKKLFAEQSAGYKAISVLQAALSAKAIAQSLIAAGKAVIAGAAKMFEVLGPLGFAAVAAMMAVMGALGFKGSAGSQKAPPTAKELQEQAGTGSVLGAPSAKSDSIAKSLDIVAANSNRDLEYSNEMLKSLRSIDDSISVMAGTVARQISVSGSMFDTSGARLGSSGSSGFLGLFSSSTTRELWDLGIKLAGSTIGQIIAQGISGQTYQIVQQVKKSSGFLGIGGGTKTTYETSTGAIDPAILGAIQGVVVNLRNGLVTASKVIGVEGAEALLDGFRVELGTLSFKDMTGEEIEKQLNAVFSKVGDDMAAALLPSLAGMQQIGEGLFETFMRVAREYEVVDQALRSIGMAFAQVGLGSVAARDRLVQLFGGLDDFVSATSFFRDNFLSEAERLAPVTAAVTAEMERLGLAAVTSKDQFKAVVAGIDLSTTAGQDLYAALLAVAPAFAKVAGAAEKAAEDAAAAADKLAAQRRSMEADLLELMGRETEARDLRRRIELDGLDPSLRSLKLTLYAWQDAAAVLAAAQDKVTSAKDALSAAYGRESAAMGEVAARWKGLGDNLRGVLASLDGAGLTGSGSYRHALVGYMRAAGGARAGNEADAGAFGDTARSFLAASEANASTRVQHLRNVAMVRRDAMAAIGMADSQASAAERSAASLKTMVSGLVQLDETTLSVAAAIAQLHQAQAEADAAAMAQAQLADPVPHLETLNTSAQAQIDALGDIRTELSRARADSAALREELRVALATIRGDTAKTASVMGTVGDGGSLKVRTEGNDTVKTVAA